MEFKWIDDDVEENEATCWLCCRMRVAISREELAALDENEPKIIRQLDAQLGNLRTAIINKIWELQGD